MERYAICLPQGLAHDKSCKKKCLVARTLIGPHIFQYGTKHFCGSSEKSNFINVSYIFIYLEYIIRECLNIFQI